MSNPKKFILSALASLILLALILLLNPAVRSAISWRYEKFSINIKNILNPPGPVPTAMPVTAPPPTATSLAVKTSTPTRIAQATATSENLPTQALLPSPPYEQQTPNNCGPATLSMALHLYGWEGDQAQIADLIKPILQDRNVNPEEMAYYIRTNAGWLNVLYRVAGDMNTLKRLLAARYPVIVESVTSLDPNDALGPTDDLWAAHYLLLTGYDDTTQTFIVQDSYHGADLAIPYDQLQAEWEPFNNLYMLLYFSQDEDEIKGLLGTDWDPDENRQRALEISQAATQTLPEDAFAWFNLGSNLVYFERYEEAALAFDKSREIGLPLRMFRYQFSPFFAYFHSNRIDDLLVLSDYARGITEMSEETWLWYGWGLYQKGDFKSAFAAWDKAISINPVSPWTRNAIAPVYTPQ